MGGGTARTEVLTRTRKPVVIRTPALRPMRSMKAPKKSWPTISPVDEHNTICGVNGSLENREGHIPMKKLLLRRVLIVVVNTVLGKTRDK